MINSGRVDEIFRECLYKKEEIIDGKPNVEPIIVEAIRYTVYFNPNRINKNKEEIVQMVNELAQEFDEGWTFLNLCYTKNMEQWTGSHRDMECLMALGVATNTLEYCVSKNFWDILPSGMPYIRRL